MALICTPLRTLGDFRCIIAIAPVIVAGSLRLHLAFAAPWSKDAIRLEVHNPTDTPITATLRG